MYVVPDLAASIQGQLYPCAISATDGNLQLPQKASTLRKN